MVLLLVLFVTGPKGLPLYLWVWKFTTSHVSLLFSLHRWPLKLLGKIYASIDNLKVSSLSFPLRCPYTSLNYYLRLVGKWAKKLKKKKKRLTTILGLRHDPYQDIVTWLVCLSDRVISGRRLRLSLFCICINTYPLVSSEMAPRKLLPGLKSLPLSWHPSTSPRPTVDPGTPHPDPLLFPGSHRLPLTHFPSLALLLHTPRLLSPSYIPTLAVAHPLRLV